MVVDDNPANLKLIEDMLRERGYEVRSFPRGRLAIAAADQEPPDLILLDINMPEMNGYEVCEQLKSNARLADIPVIFLSALNETEDKVKAFRSGGVDYISKPFQFEEVQARVRTHVNLRRAQRTEHELLERTLGGAVGTLWELVQLTSPVLALRSHAIRDVAFWMIRRMGVGEAWQYELAASLCLLGCVALPEEVFEKAYCGQELSSDEERMFCAHPESAARLLSRIPRLEVVSEIIRWQLSPEAEASLSKETRLGARLLNLALQFDQKVYRGGTPSSVLDELQRSRRFDGAMLNALASYAPAPSEFEVRRLPLRQLRSSMILERDVWSKNGNLLILKQGTVLNKTWIERLENFAKASGTEQLIDVRVPRWQEAHRR